MTNQIRAELYKLFKSKSLLKMIIVVAIIIVMAMYGGETVFGGGVIENDGQLIRFGFQTGLYYDSLNPMFFEIVGNALGCTWIYIFASMVFTLNRYCKEYKENTVKIAVASGVSRIKIFLTKYLVILIVVIVLYCVLCAALFMVEVNRMDFILTSTNIIEYFKLISANCFVYIALTSIILLFCVIVKNTGVISTVMTIYLFAPLFLFVMYIMDPLGMNLIFEIILFTNPMFYWLKISCGSVDIQLLNQLFTYVALCTTICLGSSIIVLRKQEIK